MEERSVNKLLYKIELYLLKIIPLLMMLCYLLNTILSYYGMENPILSFIGGLSILPALFLYVSSYAFRFCPYHRIPIHYCVLCDIITCYDTFVGIPVNDYTLLIINLIIFGVFAMLYLYLKFKVCKKH